MSCKMFNTSCHIILLHHGMTFSLNCSSSNVDFNCVVALDYACYHDYVPADNLVAAIPISSA